MPCFLPLELPNTPQQLMICPRVALNLLQLLALQPSSCLLLVAPSNLAADLLALRLLQSGRPASEMLRVCAFSRPYEDLLPGLEGVVLYHNGAFQLPSLQQLTANRLRVVVVTALMAAKVRCLDSEPQLQAQPA